MRIQNLWILFIVIVAVISILEAAVIRHVKRVGGNNFSEERNELGHDGFPLPRTKSHSTKYHLKWNQEDNDKSNERNLWISHPKPKTPYHGPDTQESEGPAIPKKSIWAKKRFNLKIRHRLRDKSLHEDTSVAIL